MEYRSEDEIYKKLDELNSRMDALISNRNRTFEELAAQTHEIVGMTKAIGWVIKRFDDL